MDNKYQLLSFNKDYLPIESFKLDINNRAFRYGDGFFETMHANGFDIQFIESHYKRIIKASQILKIKLPDFFSLKFLKEQVSGLLNRKKLFQGARVKVSIYRDSEGLFIPKSNNSHLLIEAQYLSKGLYELNTKGVSIGIYGEMAKPKSLFSSIKSLNAQPYILAGIFAKENQYDDALILNDDGVIIEATSSNIFLVKGNNIITPPIDSGCVDGIMRKQVLSIAYRIEYSVTLQSIKPDDLTDADELFLTNAISGIRYISGYKEKRYFKRASCKFMKELNNIAFG